MRIGLLAFALVVLALVWWSLDRTVLVPAAPEAPPSAPASGAVALGEAPAAAESIAIPEYRLDARAPSTSEPGPEELWGRVVLAGTATPVKDALVRLQHVDADGFWCLDLAYSRQVTTVASATTAADGTFRFAVSRALPYRLEARASGLVPTTKVACFGGSEVVLELTSGASLEGVVRCDGVGLGDVPVHLTVYGQPIEIATARTAADGTFFFSGAPVTPLANVRAHSPRHIEKWAQLELRAGVRHRVEIDVEAGVVVRGRVVDASTRAPVADAEVSDNWTFKRTERSGADGRFVFAGVRTHATMHVRGSGYASASAAIPASQEQEMEFALVAGAQVTGRVVTAQGTALPTAYAAVVGRPTADHPRGGHVDWIRADVDADGRFVATRLHPGHHYWLYVRSAGCGSRAYALPRALANGEQLDVGDVVLHASAGVEGRVVDDAGAPIEGARVDLRGSNDDRRAWLAPDSKPAEVPYVTDRHAVTDSKGRFRFTALAAGGFEISATRPGHQKRAMVQVTTRDGVIAEGMELVLPAGAEIAGVIRFADGHSIGDEAKNFMVAAAREGGRDVVARPEADGSFRFRGLSEGTHTVALLRCPAGWSMSPRVGIATGTKDLQLVLARSSFVAGRVVDAEGKGRVARVQARSADSRPVGGSSTDANGAFRIEVPEDFRGSVHAADAKDHLLHGSRDDVTAGQSEVVLQLVVPEEIRRLLRSK